MNKKSNKRITILYEPICIFVRKKSGPTFLKSSVIQNLLYKLTQKVENENVAGSHFVFAIFIPFTDDEKDSI